VDSSSDGGDDEERSELLGWVCRRRGLGLGVGCWVGFVASVSCWVGFGRGWVVPEGMGTGSAGGDGYG
jgi:hypothetical protein